MSTTCLDDEIVAALVRGDVSPPLAAARSHLLDCEACQDLLALATPHGGLGVGDVLVDRYRVDAEIGRGGMGIVYQARDLKLERDLAIKILHCADASAHARMNEEAQILARLSHPNIVTVFDVVVRDGQVCMVMELVRGTSLRAWLSTLPPFTDRVVALAKAGEGLFAAHRAGLVHRDFKPENVMIADGGQVKICDFGLATTDVVRTVAHDAESVLGNVALHRLTRTGKIVGTPAYMAPEQFAGKGASERSDQFAFAVCAWEALFSEHPFSAEDIGRLRRNFDRGPRARLASSTPTELRKALTRALSPRPEERHESLDALLESVRRGSSPRTSTGKAVLGVAVVAGAFALFAASTRLRASHDPAHEQPVAATSPTTIERAPLPAPPASTEAVPSPSFRPASTAARRASVRVAPSAPPGATTAETAIAPKKGPNGTPLID